MLDGPPPSSSVKSTFPREFGSYLLLEEIARGGMGIVYKARQVQIERMVALKVMAGGQLAETDFVKRFRTEAEAVAKLDHPNIVPIYEVGECEGQPFFSMKLFEGGSLSARIANAASPILAAAAAEMLVMLARAVHYAHQRGILHRDIKPGNILLDGQGKPHLTDFGLAKLVEKDSTLTRTMAMLGTPSYMSPEQARGEAKQLTVSVDIYGLGAILYELLAGQPPFAGGTTMETVRQVLEKEPRRPSALKAGVDRDLETICLKCLEKEPGRRYGSAEALADDLERRLRHEPIQARPATPVERVAKLVRRHPVGATFCTAILLIIALSVAMLARANVRIRKAQSVEIGLRNQAEGRAEENRQQLVRLSVSTGNRLVDEGDYYRALIWFSEAMRLENGDEAREDIHRRRFGAVLRQSPELAQIWFHNEIILSAGFSLSGDRVLSSGSSRELHVWDVASGEPALPPILLENDVRTAKFSPDGRRIAAIDARQKAWFWDSATGERLDLPDAALQRGQFRDVEFSPDGKWVALAGSSGVQLCDPVTGAIGPLLVSTNGSTFCHFSHGSHLLGAVMKGEAKVWTLRSGEWFQKTLKHSADIWRLTFSHDEKWVATTTDHKIFIWDAATGEMLRSFDSAGNLFDCQFSPDGRWLVVASWGRNLRLIGTDNFQERITAMRHRTGIACARFSTAPQRLATCSWDFTARVWNPDTGEPASPWLVHGGYVLALDFSSDSSRLVTAGQDQTVRLWNLRTNDGAFLKLRHERGISSVKFSPDGERLFTCGRDGRANIWDAHSGRLLVALPRRSQEIAAGSFSPNGTTIVTAGADGVCVWNSQTGGQLGKTMDQSEGMNSVSFNLDDRRVISANTKGTVFVWNVADGSLVTQISGHDGDVVRISSDGHRVLTASKDGTARILDVESGKPIGHPMKHVPQVADAQFSPDGRHIVTACTDSSQAPRAAQMWDATMGTPVGPEMAHQDGVLCTEYSPDGKFIATGGEDRVAIVWDAATGKRLTPGMPHPTYVSKVKFSPDSRLLLTFGTSGVGTGFARVWEAATGEPVTPPLMHPAFFADAAWSPDGRQLVLAGNDGAATFWDISGATGSVESLRRRAETLSAHRLDPNHTLLPLTAKELKERWGATKAEHRTP
jgi:WD40 repeat protein/predicted Ser/Thr protein kinase